MPALPCLLAAPSHHHTTSAPAPPSAPPPIAAPPGVGGSDAGAERGRGCAAVQALHPPSRRVALPAATLTPPVPTRLPPGHRPNPLPPPPLLKVHVHRFGCEVRCPPARRMAAEPAGSSAAAAAGWAWALAACCRGAAARRGLGPAAPVGLQAAIHRSGAVVAVAADEARTITQHVRCTRCMKGPAARDTPCDTLTACAACGRRKHEPHDPTWCKRVATHLGPQQAPQPPWPQPPPLDAAAPPAPPPALPAAKGPRDLKTGSQARPAAPATAHAVPWPPVSAESHGVTLRE